MNIQSNKFAKITLLFTASVFIISCSLDKKETEFKTNKAVFVKTGVPTQQSNDKITVSGQIESGETIILSTRIMGFITSIKVKPGDKVQKGQLLVTINNDDILAKRAQAQAMILEVEAAEKDALKDYERFKALNKQQSASDKEFENAALHYNSLKAKAEAARQMKNEAEAMLTYSNLVAPFSGVITQKHIEEGGMASPGMPILSIEQSNSYNVMAFVSDNEVGKLTNGMAADVIVKSTGKKITAKIIEISPSAQLTGGQYQIKLNVPVHENEGLFSGMYVSVNIILTNTSRADCLLVPLSAIIHKEQLSGIYTISNDQTAQLRWLKVGKEYGGQIEILSGLSPDENFIKQSEGRLYNGAPVLVKQ